MLNWPEFEKLPDSPRSNFEILCRSLIWLHYGRFGRFAALANQPGVEFHLKLHEKCAIGDAGRWFGWQCRWYEARPGKALGNARRKKIEDALRKTVKALPDLTDWILWTRHPLTKADQVWFYGLETNMQLDWWTAANVEALLSGEGEILRRTYFGELVFTPIALAQQHELSVASIKKRWLPKAHQVVDAERTLRRMLGEPSSWNELAHVSERILNATTLIKKTAAASQGSLSRSTPMFVHSAEALAKTLKDVHQLLQDGDLAFLRQRLDTRPRGVSRDVAAGPRRLRGAKLSCGLDATNALADMRLGVQLLNEAHDFLETRSVAVVADAGGGKTQLAAQLTAALPHRPAGILLYGRDLHSGLDDLAKSICIQGDPVPSMEALVAALDAAGQRARRRLPLVIDGPPAGPKSGGGLL